MEIYQSQYYKEYKKSNNIQSIVQQKLTKLQPRAESFPEDKMSEDDISKEITSAWEEFTKNSDKAKEDILSAFNEDIEADEPMGKIILLGVGTLICILVVFPIYFCIKAIMKKNN